MSMDMTIASTGWELLAQLATCASMGDAPLEVERCARKLADLVARFLPSPTGRLEVIEEATIVAEASWGEAPEDATPLLLQADGELLGRLHLGGEAVRLDPAFARALAAQLSLMLLTRRRNEEAALSEQIRALVASSLEQVGALDGRTLLQALLTRVAPLIGVEHGAIYTFEEADGQLVLMAAGDGAFQFPGVLPLAGASLPTRVARSRAPEVGSMHPAGRRRGGASHGERAALALPLLSQERLIGVLVLLLTHHAGSRLRRLAGLFAAQSILIVRNAQLFSREQQRARELFVLYEISQAVYTDTQIESVLNRATENIAAALGAEYCLVLLRDEHADDTLYVAGSFSETRPSHRAGNGIRAGLIGAADVLAQLGLGDQVVIEDTAAIADHHAIARHLADDGCRSALLLPMRGKAEMIGFMVIGFARPRRPVSSAERNLAQVLATQIATAIFNRRLYLAERQRASELALLQQVSQRLNAGLNLDQTLTAILEGVQALVRFSGAQISLYDWSTRLLRPGMRRGLSGSDWQNIASDAWFQHYQAPLRVDDLQQLGPELHQLGRLSDLRFDDGLPVRAYVGMPLRLGDETLGLLELFAARPAAFSDDDTRLLSIVAGQSAQAIANATRYEQTDASLRARIEQLRALQRVSSQLAITLDRSEILEYVLEQALRVTGATQGLIALRAVEGATDREVALNALGGAYAPEIYQRSLDDADAVDDDLYVVVEAVGFGESHRASLLGNPLPAGLRTAYRALARREPQIGHELDPAELMVARAPAARSALAAPIFYQAGVYGVMLLLAPRPRAFDQDAVEFLRALSHQTAVGIGNAQRYAELEHLYRVQKGRAQILNNVLEIGQALRADRNLANLLEQIGYSAVESLNFRTVIFCLTDRERPDLLRPVAAAGIPLSEQERMARTPLPMELAQRYLNPRFRMGRCYFVPAEESRTLEAGFLTEIFSYQPFNDARAPHEWQPEDRLCVPLSSTEGALLGLMFASDPQDRRRPSPRVVEPLAIFADQAAIAIENHLLLDDTRARAEQMAALFKVGAAAASTTDLDTLLQRVYEEIVAYLGTPSYFYIASYRPETEQIRFELFMRRGEVLATAHRLNAPRAGLTALIIESGEALLIGDLQNEPQYLTQTVNYAEGDPPVRSWLGVPLISQGRVTGVLSVQDVAPNVFTERDRQFLTALANQLAIAMERATLFKERERRLAELNIINRIGQITSSTLDLEQMIRQTYLQLAAFLPLDSFFIFVYHEDENLISLSLEVDEGIEALDRQPCAPDPGSLVETIVRTRRHLRFDDLGREYRERGLAPTPFDGAKPSAAWLGVPLLVGDGSVVGVIAVMSYEPGIYGERELAFMTTVANQLALGVHNARLLAQAREQVHRLELLNRVSVLAAAETDVQRIYQNIVDAMADATGVDQARLVIYDRKRGVAPAVAEHIPSGLLDQIEVPIANNPAVAWLDEHKAPLVSLDAQHDPLFAPSHPTFAALDIRSIATVPIIIDGQVIGAVGLDFVGRRGTFQPQILTLCQMIANQTSTAIARAQAFDDAQRNAAALQQKVAEQTTLLDAARILSSLLRPQEVLDKLMELVSRRLQVTTVALWTINDENLLVPVALNGIAVEQARHMRIPVGQGFTGRVAATGKPLVIDDVNVTGGSLFPDFQRANNLISYMGVPVIYREQIIGVLSVMTNVPRRFTSDEQTLLAGLANQAAAALENARLFEEREQRINELTTINKISAAVNASLELQTLLEKLHAGIAEVIDVSTSLIGIYDAQHDTLHFPLACDQGRPVSMPARVHPQGANGWVIRNGQSLLIRTPAEAAHLGLNLADDQICVGPDAQSFLVTPILFGQDVLGVINVQSQTPRAFDENDRRFLATVANQAAVALNNARLFSETRQHAREMTTLFEVTQNLSGTLDPDETTHLVADAALSLLGVELCAVLRLDHQGRVARQVLLDRHRHREDLHINFRLDGMTARLLASGQLLAISDLREYADANPDALSLGIRSVLGIALGPPDERLGVLWVGNRRRHEWTDHQISLCSILANQAGQALQSAHLFDLEQQRRRLADTLRDVAQSFTSTLALEEIQTLILDQLSRVVVYDTAAVLLRDEGHGYLHITEARGLEAPALLTATFDAEQHELLALLTAERRPVLIADTALDPRFTPLARLGWQAGSWIGAPLLVDNELVGMLAVGAAMPHVYDEEAVGVTFALANQASQAIQNARLFGQISNLAADLERRVSERTAEAERNARQLAEEKERLEAVHAITLELTTQLDLDAIIQRALELISLNLEVSRGSIILCDPSSSDLICRAVLDDRGEVRLANFPLRFLSGESLAKWVMQHQEPVNISDVRLDQRWLQESGRADDVRSVAAVPLNTGDTRLGVLVLTSPEVGYFTDSQMNLLGTIAGVVAAALSNAQLYSYINDLASSHARLLAEQREETSKSNAVFQSLTEGVIVLDVEQRVILYNPAAARVLEIPAEAMLHQPLRILETYGADETERKRAATIYNGLTNGLRQVREGARPYSTYLDLSDPSQVIAVNLALVMSNSRDGQCYGSVAVLRDITREIEADHAKRQFISDVSHELRTPLTSVKGYVDMLLLTSAGSLSEEQIAHLQVIKANTNRLHALIEDILDFARPDSKQKLNFTRVEISQVINDVLQSLRLEYERKHMQVTVDIAPDLPPLVADQKRITQVFQNLFSNAVKYTYEGGRIQVRAFLNPANMLQIDVEDNGVGMTREQLKKLFRPFYRADNPLRDVAGGTGLGLAIAKQFVEQHGGEMWVQSEQGKGSIFSFMLPLEQAGAHEAHEDPE
ncbi:MAG: GAF domain-containing protein [Chloroflexaceae bacterium]